MVGKTISHYEIVAKLGVGGMGVVYKAQDTTLERFVALKFLPPHLSQAEEEKKRFIQEAKAASALDHPNVCGIYEIGESDGQLFIAMAYYEGQTLKQRIESGAMSVGEDIDIAIQVAEGLSKAHEKEIVHRDIKPANIIITDDGVAKIVDFGLAKLAGESRLTKTGTTLGTVAYMSPEQTRGDQVDHRTDIWSLGVVLYEMVSGQLPFRAEYEQAIFYSILNEEPAPLENLPTDVPREFETVVMNCLEKNTSDRYQTVDELLTDLRQLQEELKPGGVPFKRIVRKRLPQKPLRTLLLPAALALILVAAAAGYFFFGREVKGVERIPIAVVDFVNETEERALDGLSGMLITSLEQSRRLSVLTRSRMFDILKQMGKENVGRIDETLGREICKQAGVNAMALASVKKLGRVYTIDLKVLDTEKDEYLFTDLAQGEGQESVLTMIDNLSQRTREEFGEDGKEIQMASKKIAQVTTSDLVAYQHYFRGERLMKQSFQGAEKWQEAENEYLKAIEIDSTFGLAYFGLARIKGHWWGLEHLAKPYMLKALARIDHIPEKDRYLVRAHHARFEKSFEEALSILKEMEKYYPDDEEMLLMMGEWTYAVAARTNESERYAVAANYLEKVLDLNPENISALARLQGVYGRMKMYEKMLDVSKRYVAVSGSVASYLDLAKAYIKLQENDTAMQTLNRARELFPEDPDLINDLADLHIYQENYEKAEAELKTLAADPQPLRHNYGVTNLSYFYPYIGKYQEALKFKDKRIELMWQQNDTSRVLFAQFEKARLFIWGWNDTTRALREYEKAFRLKKEALKNPILMMQAAFFNGLIGNYDALDSMAQSVSQLPSLGWMPSYVNALIQTRNQECEKAEPATESEIISLNHRLILLYSLAQCQFEDGALDKAIKTLNMVKAIGVYDFDYDIRAVIYPRTFYLLGKIYEESGERQLAIQNYSKFLDLWKSADEDLPDLIDAKTRLARLKG